MATYAMATNWDITLDTIIARSLMLKNRKNVKITLCDPPSTFCSEGAFEVKKVINTLQVKVGEYVDEELVKRWIRDNENWTIEFVR